MIEMDKRREAVKRAVLNHAATWLTRITSENLVRIDDVRSGHPQTRKYDNSGRNRDTLDRSVGYVIEPGTRDGRDEQHGWLHLVRSALPFGHGKVPITHCVEDMRDVLDDEIDYFLELGIDPRLVADYRRQLHEFFGTLFHAQTGYLDNQAFEAELQRLVTELTAAREALATAADHAPPTDTDEHQMLVEIHHAVTNDLATKSDVNRAKRVVVKAILTNRNSEADLDGPQNETRRRQVEAVKALMRKAYHESRRLTLNHACLEVWTPLKDGYPTPKALYDYCHAHELEF